MEKVALELDDSGCGVVVSFDLDGSQVVGERGSLHIGCMTIRAFHGRACDGRRLDVRACDRVASEDVKSWTIHGLWPQNFKGLGLCSHQSSKFIYLFRLEDDKNIEILKSILESYGHSMNPS